MSKRNSKDAVKGDLVQIHKTILTPEQRPDTLPKETKAVPYEAWIKGFLLEDEASIGDTVRIQSYSGRVLSGTLVTKDPAYEHNFGRPQRDLLSVAIKHKWQIEGS